MTQVDPLRTSLLVKRCLSSAVKLPAVVMLTAFLLLPLPVQAQQKNDDYRLPRTNVTERSDWKPHQRFGLPYPLCGVRRG